MINEIVFLVLVQGDDPIDGDISDSSSEYYESSSEDASQSDNDTILEQAVERGEARQARGKRRATATRGRGFGVKRGRRGQGKFTIIQSRYILQCKLYNVTNETFLTFMLLPLINN